MQPSIVEKLMYGENPLFSMLEKRGDTGMLGDTMPVPIQVGNPQGVSIPFATAQTNATNTTNAKFSITAGDYHGVVAIGDKVLEASRSNPGAFFSNKTWEIDGLYETAGDSLSAYLWGNGGQAIGQIATVATTLITLTKSSDSTNFENGMVLVASADDGSDSAHALRSGNEALTGINRAKGELTGADWTTISSIAAGDYLFRQGDFFGNSANIVIKGVQAFVTTTDSPMALWGITANTRATDPQRYAGCRVDPTLLNGKTMDERIKILLAQMVGRFKAKAPTAGFLHPEDFQTLETLMSARGIRALEDADTKFGFSKIEIQTAGGRIPIYTDRHCPKDHFFALRLEDWWISSMGELLHPQKGDGLEMLRKNDSTDYEFRLISYPLLANRAPKNSGRCPLS